MDAGAGVVEVMVNSGSNPPVQHALLPDETRTVTVVMRFRCVVSAIRSASDSPSPSPHSEARSSNKNI